MPTRQPKVSINLCCYNSERYLRETLDSIINQTFKSWELVIIDDGSSDSTESIIQEYIKKGYPIVYHYHTNKGLAHSRNEAFKRSNGEFIAFIDHDDLWLPDKLEKQLSVFENDPAIDFVYSNCRVHDTIRNKKRSFLRGKQPQGDVFEEFLRYYPAVISTVVIRRVALLSLDEYFDNKLRYAEEFDVFMRVLMRSRAAYVNEQLAIYRVHPNMASIKLDLKKEDEILYVIDKLRKCMPSFDNKYKKSIDYLYSIMAYDRANIQMARLNFKHAREILLHTRWPKSKFYFLYILTFSPKRIWQLLNRYVGRFNA
jgi:glycosyltransferase involved in cell wall biosynthesis